MAVVRAGFNQHNLLRKVYFRWHQGWRNGGTAAGALQSHGGAVGFQKSVKLRRVFSVSQSSARVEPRTRFVSGKDANTVEMTGQTDVEVGTYGGPK